MKNIKILFIINLIFITNLFADCKILNFGEVQKSSKGFFKDEIPKIVDYQAYSSAKPRLVKDNKGEYQFKTFIDSYNEFFIYIRDISIKTCETNGYKGISNLDIKFSTDDKTYYFTATLNYFN
ncbi:hypothetical protein AAX26_01100 [Aliarcobacter thereius]|uniref:Uncharacterized protein n=2 Tax=Aliarcobacter thereius TaxID=544718 RepID=A0A5R9H7V8_9BACT|nr:hypothetical protein [Aliarcobacter thereius]OCL86794.1 hypothetical protein AAX26_01100 [Aliarcobacter thereius]TLS72065.1 hypothetical protein FE246_06465 [Aliarcobacter thereius]